MLQRVLYVEDDADISGRASSRTARSPWLASLTLQAWAAACGVRAEALAQAEAFAPHLLLLDVMMPGMDGPTTLARLRELPATREVPVIFMTAKVQAREIEHYKALGALGVISKPFDPMTLAAQVKALWQQGTRGQAGA